MIAAAFFLMQLGLTSASTWVTQPVGTETDLHVVRAIDPSVAWAAGNNGICARTADGGLTWFANPIYSCTTCPITGLIAHDADSAVATTGGRPSRIYVTGDGGRSWSVRWESDQHEVHLAGLAFFSAHRGFAVGDPQGGRFVLLTTEDGGATWTEAPAETLPAAQPGERVAAASGTGAVAVSGESAALGVTGGPAARVFRTTDGGKSWRAAKTRLAALHGMAFANPMDGIAVGSARGRANVVRTTDGGASWSEPSVAALPGPKEGVAYVPGTSGRSVVVVGAAGSALSTDGGRTWHVMDRAPAHAVAFSGLIDAGWKVGAHGSVKKLLRGVSSRSRITEAAPKGNVLAPELGKVEPAPTPRPDAPPEALGTHPVKPGTKLEN